MITTTAKTQHDSTHVVSKTGLFLSRTVHHHLLLSDGLANVEPLVPEAEAICLRNSRVRLRHSRTADSSRSTFFLAVYTYFMKDFLCIILRLKGHESVSIGRAFN